MRFDWARDVAACVDYEPEAVFKMLSDEHIAQWGEHRNLQRFLAECWPREWERVRECRTTWRKKEREEDGLEIVITQPCCDKPFCPACNDQWMRKRARGLMKRLRAATPRHEEVCGYLVTVAVTRDDEQERFVQAAALDWQEFRTAAYRMCERMYGECIGAFATYQAYGEQILVRDHPHVHLLVNGWRLNQHGKPKRTPMFELRPTKEAFERIAFEEMQRAFRNTGATRVSDWFSPTSLDIRWLGGAASVAKACKYVERELIDFRKFRYRDADSPITVESYKVGGPVASTSLADLQRRLSLYQVRLGHWGQSGRRPCDSALGELSDKRISDTTSAMGSVEEHREDCWCKECSTWGRLIDGETRASPLSVRAKLAR